MMKLLKVFNNCINRQRHKERIFVPFWGTPKSRNLKQVLHKFNKKDDLGWERSIAGLRRYQGIEQLGEADEIIEIELFIDRVDLVHAGGNDRRW